MRCPSCHSDNGDAVENCIACGRGLFALTRGETVSGRYQILDIVGRGGMGLVYKARDLDLDEVVALKVLLPPLAGSSQMATRFRQEIKLARRVTHPNVCRIYEYGRDQDRAYIVMEYVDGADFKALLRERGPLTWEEAVEVLVQVCRGLDAVHREGIVHRDLKTRNLMRDTRGRVRLMDFGLARSAEMSAGTSTGLVVGTPEYMSPEQARGRPLDGRSDIYALGVVTFELLTGDVPFGSTDAVEVLRLQVEEPPPLDGPRARRIPASLRSVLRRALDKQPAQRYSTALELAAALERARDQARAGTGQESRRPSPSGGDSGPTLPVGPDRDGASPTPDRRRWLIVTSLAGVAAGILLLTLPRRSAPPVDSVREASPTPAAADPAALPAPALVPETRPSVAPRRSPARRVPGIPSPTAEAPASPTPEPSPTLPSPVPEPIDTTPAAGPTFEAPGRLQLLVLPWAEVSVDGIVVGTTPLMPIALAPGEHEVRLVNPAYHPLKRKVRIRSGATERLEVDLAAEAFPK
jgi:serine/threonine-protein kinase